MAQACPSDDDEHHDEHDSERDNHVTAVLENPWLLHLFRAHANDYGCSSWGITKPSVDVGH